MRIRLPSGSSRVRCAGPSPGSASFRGLPFAHGDEYFELDAQIPVVAEETPL